MHVLIVEDEPIIAQRLQRQVKQILGDQLDRLTWYDNLDDAELFISENVIDLLLLDLNLHGENGFELLKRMTAESFHTIIISAYFDKAIHAFEYGVLDFIAKPFNLERLAQAIARYQHTNSHSHYTARYLSVKKSGQIELIAIADIDYISASGHYSELYCGNNSSLHDKSIEKITNLLPKNFERIHRSYLVNMNRVKRLIVEAGSKYSIELRNGTILPVGRTRYANIKQKLG